MGSVKMPSPPKPPAPIAEDVTENIAEDLLKERMKRKRGMSASLLTAGQRTSANSKTLLGVSSNSKLG